MAEITNVIESFLNSVHKIAEHARDWCENVNRQIKKIVGIRQSGDDLKHRSFTLGLSETFALVAFSGNSNKIGRIAIYKHQSTSTGFEFDYLDGFLLKENRFVAKHPNTIKIDKGGELVIHDEKDIANFNSIKIEDTNIRLHPDTHEHNVLVDKMNEECRRRERETFDVFANEQEHRSIFTTNLKDKVYEKIEQNVDYTTSYYNLEMRMEEVLTDVLGDRSNNSLNRMITLYNEHRNRFYREKNYPKWHVTNCAEYHVMTAFQILVPENIKYLRTFKNRPGKLEILPPCANCVITTKNLSFDTHRTRG